MATRLNHTHNFANGEDTFVVTMRDYIDFDWPCKDSCRSHSFVMRISRWSCLVTGSSATRDYHYHCIGSIEKSFGETQDRTRTYYSFDHGHDNILYYMYCNIILIFKTYYTHFVIYTQERITELNSRWFKRTKMRHLTSRSR